MENTIKFKGWACHLLMRPFVKGGFRLDLIDAIDGEPIATLNKYIQGLAHDEIAIDINNCGHEATQVLMANGIILPDLLREIQTGWCNYPVYKLNPKFIS